MTSKVKLVDTWRYFAGCCWTEITTRQQMAVTALAGGEPGEVSDPSAEWDDSHRSAYEAGFDDGRNYERDELARKAGDAEEAYDRGFRAGAARRESWEATAQPQEWMENS